MRKYLVVLFLFVVSCKTPTAPAKPITEVDNRDSVIVGMTYDEVERLLGKPTEIERGVNQLRSDQDNPSADIVGADLEYSDRGEYLQVKKEELELRIRMLKSGQETDPRKIESVGSLLYYVTWVYDQSRIDTMTYLQPVWRTRSVATTPIVEYLVNNLSVSKGDYELTGDTAYWNAGKTFLFEKENWLKWIELGMEFVPAERAVKEIKKTPRTEKRTFVIPDTCYQAIFSRYSIIFDAASGRVTLKGYVPYQVSNISPMKKTEEKP